MTHLRHIPLGYGGEFSIISAALKRWGSLASGIGDDCAVLEVPAGERLLLSVDTAVEGVHFRRPWLTPEEIGYRATMAAFSDLAAMAAVPSGIAIALTLPDAWREEFVPLCDGIGEATRAVGARIIGGDLSRGADLALSLTVVGHVATPLSREGARPGDALWVTGRLGGPFRALRAWESGDTPDAASRQRFARPAARFEPARWLAAHGVTAGLDLSDGLLSDAGHLAAAGGVQLVVNLDRLPTLGEATVEEAAQSGEEYELLVTGPASLDAKAFEAAFGIPLTCIGAVVPPLAGEPAVEALRHGTRMALPRGHDHFPPP
ncbi:MAG: thiamine-phosphate kinase [Gemmatimonadaceae bacterium]|nr:thiamine-phosphate kinase [Gemmatimonadaceae bacterium]